MTKLTGLALICMVALAVTAGPASAADRVAVDNAIAALTADLPSVGLYREGQRIARVYGTPMGFGATADESADLFVAARAGVFGVDPGDLELAGFAGAADLVQPVMYDPQTGDYKFFLCRYVQTKDGIPVYDSDLRVLVRNAPGFPVVLASSSLHDLGDFIPTAGPVTVSKDLAKAAVAAAIRADIAGAARLEFFPELSNFSQPEQVIWAGVNDMVVQPRRAVTYVADNGMEGTSEDVKWRFVADAVTGEILHAENLIIFTDVTGNVSGLVTEGSWGMQCSPEVSTPFPYASVNITGGSSAYADADGNFVIPNGGSSAVTVNSPMSGLYFYVDNVAGGEDSLSQSVTPPGPANFLHNAANNSDAVRAQSNGYVQANEVRTFALDQNPAYPVISTQTNFPVYVNRTDGYCPGNAWYDGYSINFCSAGSGYSNTAFASVLQHEYGHHLVESAGSGQGAYGEGMGDCISMLIADDPRLGVGFYTDDCTDGIRNANNTMQYPCTGEIHDCGQLLSGCVWSTRNELFVTEPADYLSIISSLTVNSILLHTGESITPSICTDFLTLDDDDGDLSNGTPHYDEITTGFAAHNMWAGPPPAHDDCANALPACPGTPVSGDTGAATNDGSSSCGDSNGSPDLWYYYTPAASGTATFSLCSGTNYDSVLSVHSGCPGTSSNDLGCDDDGCGSGGGPSTVTISVVAGNTYYIRVTGWQGSAGSFTLNITGPECGAAALTMSFPDGVPDTLTPGEATNITVSIEDGAESYVPGSGLLYYRYDGGSYLTSALSPLGGDLYQATLPPALCEDAPEFYFSAQGDGGTIVTSPGDAPTSVYSAFVGMLTVVMADDFETNQGWTVSGNATTGQWQRGVPVNCNRGDPPNDFDGSGQCYLTGNSASNCDSDVDGGTTYLVSPTIDLSSGDADVHYALWYTNNYGGDPNNDLFKTYVSNDNGSSWVLAETIGPATPTPITWKEHTFTVGDFVTPTAQVKVRFEASDLGSGSVVEAGIDDFSVKQYSCENPNPCFGDLDGDNDVDLSDLATLLANYGTTSGASYADGDLDGDGDVDLQDLAALLAVYGTPC